MILMFSLAAPRCHHDMMLLHGYVRAKIPLTPRESAVMRLLLTAMTEKQIAEKLGLTWRTTAPIRCRDLPQVGVRGRIG